MTEDDLSDCGPAMRALSERRRLFVQIMVGQAVPKPSVAVRQAGFECANINVARQTAFKLMHSEKVLAAIREEVTKRIQIGAMVGVFGLQKIAEDPKHKDHLKACIALADRGGYSSEQHISVKHEHTDRTGAALMDRIRELAAKHGLDPARLLAGETPQPRVIEHVGDSEKSVVDAVEVAKLPDVGGSGP